MNIPILRDTKLKIVERDSIEKDDYIINQNDTYIKVLGVYEKTSPETFKILIYDMDGLLKDTLKVSKNTNLYLYSEIFPIYYFDEKMESFVFKWIENYSIRSKVIPLGQVAHKEFLLSRLKVFDEKIAIIPAKKLIESDYEYAYYRWYFLDKYENIYFFTIHKVEEDMTEKVIILNEKDSYYQTTQGIILIP